MNEVEFYSPFSSILVISRQHNDSARLGAIEPSLVVKNSAATGM